MMAMTVPLPQASKLEESVLERNLAGCSYFSVQPMQIRNQVGGRVEWEGGRGDRGVLVW